MIGSIGSSYTNYSINETNANVSGDMSAQASGDVEFSYNSQDSAAKKRKNSVPVDFSGRQ